MDRYDIVAREDLVTFLAAATTDTQQPGFYSAARSAEMDFLHEYVRINYRDLYATTLALAVNDLNAGRVISDLLAHSDGLDAETRRAEGALIARRLNRMPPQRVWKMLEALCRAGRGNRRLRKIAQEWLDGRDVAFDAVKYRRRVRLVVRHLHLRVPPEVADVLTGRWRRPGWKPGTASPERAPANTEGSSEFALLDLWRRAHYEDRAVFELPFTVAEGLAAKRGIDRATLLRRGNLTAQERLRLTTSATRIGVAVGPKLDTVGLDRLVTYVLSLDLAERERRRTELAAALAAAATRVAGGAAGTWGKVTAVLDDSYSSSGSTIARRRPLIAALACSYALKALAGDFRQLWTSGNTDPLLAVPRGATDLANPIIDALDGRPELLIVVSDGVDTAPPGAAGEVLRVWSERISDGATTVMHLNPAYEPASFGARTLTPAVPTLGMRYASDLPILRSLAQLAMGRMNRAELSAWLKEQAS